MENKSILMDEIRMLLAEKRTSLSVLRTGLALFSVPLSILTVLTATSQHYKIEDVMYLFVFLVIVNIALMIFGTFLISRATRTIRQVDLKIKKIRKKL